MTEGNLDNYILPKKFEKYIKEITKEINKICDESPDKQAMLNRCKELLIAQIKEIKLRGTLG